MNGPLKNFMYKLRPVFQLPEQVELPKNMYPLRKIQAVGENDVPHVQRDIEDKVKKILKLAAGDSAALEKRWDLVLEQLHDLLQVLQNLKQELGNMKKENGVEVSSHPSTSKNILFSCSPQKLEVLQGAVIRCDPANPPYSLLLLRKLLNDINISLSCHTHSSTSVSSELIEKFSVDADPGKPALRLVIIWKQGTLDPELVLNPLKQTAILGEVNILRLLARLGVSCLAYEENEDKFLIDSILDTTHRLVHARAVKEKQSLIRSLNAKLGKKSFFGGNEINICDLAVYSALNRSGSEDLSPNLQKWVLRVASI